MCYESPEARAKRQEAFKNLMTTNCCIRMAILANSAVIILAALIGLIAGSWLQHYYVGKEPIHAVWVSIVMLVCGILGVVSMIIKRYDIFFGHYIMVPGFIYPVVLQLTNSLGIYRDCISNSGVYCPDLGTPLSITIFSMAGVLLATAIVIIICFIVAMCKLSKANHCHQVNGDSEKA